MKSQMQELLHLAFIFKRKSITDQTCFPNEKSAKQPYPVWLAIVGPKG